MTNGVEHNPPDWYGDFVRWDQIGGRLLTSSALFCVRVSQDQFDYFGAHNPSNQGTYQQAALMKCGLVGAAIVSSLANPPSNPL